MAEFQHARLQHFVDMGSKSYPPVFVGRDALLNEILTMSRTTGLGGLALLDFAGLIELNTQNKKTSFRSARSETLDRFLKLFRLRNGGRWSLSRWMRRKISYLGSAQPRQIFFATSTRP